MESRGVGGDSWQFPRKHWEGELFFPTIPVCIASHSSNIFTSVTLTMTGTSFFKTVLVDLSIVLSGQQYLVLPAFPSCVYAITCHQWQPLSVLLCKRKWAAALGVRIWQFLRCHHSQHLCQWCLLVLIFVFLHFGGEMAGWSYSDQDQMSWRGSNKNIWIKFAYLS